MNEERERLLRLLRDELPEAQAEALRRRLAHDPALRARLDRLRALDTTLGAGTMDAFAPYFSERVMRRLRRVEEPSWAAASFYESLQGLFVRVAVAGLLVAIGLGTLNALDPDGMALASSTLEAVFGLPSTTLDTLFFLEGI
ncbi:MAG: anti-sigma factor family protein [Rhodothermales bacterium]